jgi:hypothetical protein
VLAAVKPSRHLRLIQRVDRGSAPAASGWSPRNPAL